MTTMTMTPISPKAVEILRLAYPHHKDITGDDEDAKCPKGCYRCEIEEYVKLMDELMSVGGR